MSSGSRGQAERPRLARGGGQRANLGNGLVAPADDHRLPDLDLGDSPGERALGLVPMTVSTGAVLELVPCQLG